MNTCVIWPSRWKPENFPAEIHELSHTHTPSLVDMKFVVVAANKLEGRRTTSEVAQTQQAQSLLKLNNSWPTELSWPWKIPTVETWHCSFRAERRSWDRQIQTHIQSFLVSFLSFVDAVLESQYFSLSQRAFILYFITVFDYILYFHKVWEKTWLSSPCLLFSERLYCEKRRKGTVYITIVLFYGCTEMDLLHFHTQQCLPCVVTAPAGAI